MPLSPEVSVEGDGVPLSLSTLPPLSGTKWGVPMQTDPSFGPQVILLVGHDSLRCEIYLWTKL